MKKTQTISRRRFLQRSTAAASGIVLPAIVPAKVLGKDAPSNKVHMAIIGTGNQGTNDMRGFLQNRRVRVVAVCDVNRKGPGYWGGAIAGREPGRIIVNEHYQDNACGAYEDYRELLARSEIDAVEIATPDHWHAPLALDVAKAGKDIYGQKPLSLTISDGRLMADAIARYGRVWRQTGSQQRSDWNFRRACELVLNGRIGKLHTVKCGLPGGIPDYGRSASQTQPAPVPDGFNYEIHLYESRDHFRNFIDCVISRKETVAPIEVAHRSITIAHLGNIAFMMGRDLKWDPDKETFIDDDSANRLKSRAAPAPWCYA